MSEQYLHGHLQNRPRYQILDNARTNFRYSKSTFFVVNVQVNLNNRIIHCLDRNKSRTSALWVAVTIRWVRGHMVTYACSRNTIGHYRCVMCMVVFARGRLYVRVHVTLFRRIGRSLLINIQETSSLWTTDYANWTQHVIFTFFFTPFVWALLTLFQRLNNNVLP